MTFFENLGGKISQASQGTVKKAKNLADIAKYNNQRNDEEIALQAIYAQLGKAYFEQKGEQPDEAFRDLCEKAKEIKARILNLDEELMRCKNIRTCPACGAKNGYSGQFCSTCGAKLPVPEVVEAEAATETEALPAFCQNCGIALSPGTQFCQNCGVKV